MRGWKALHGKASLVVVAALLGVVARADGGESAAEDYLPADVEYQPEVPTPRSVLGFEVGEWHVRHDLLVRYFRALAEASDRVRLTEYGRTHEERPLLLAQISAPENLDRLDQIRQEHLASIREPDRSPDEPPLVVWMGYSIHGNEPSGANASLLLAYHLAAGSSQEIECLLEETVILVDPCLNPDGLSRFTQWANGHRGKNLVADPNHREHRERWPSGRGNHYWFDLNRDWLLLTHPESRGRLQAFHRWKPHLLTDFHEMGRNSTYFFQPGVPSRQNPWTPEKNLALTREIARYHAEAMDARGELYYTEERFDDFYYGKGSTYPDVNGSVGILFEQASSRGHRQESDYRELSFPMTIRNQLTTSLSTLRAADEMREELRAYPKEFYATAMEQARKDSTRAYVFESAGDPMRAYHLMDILRRHEIRVHELGAPVTVQDRRFEPGQAAVVPVAQRQYRLLQSLFEKRTEFPDHTFYDVSTWNFPLAFGLPYAPIPMELFEEELVGAPIDDPSPPRRSVHGPEDGYAYLFEWSGYYAPRGLNRLLQDEIKAGVATEGLEAVIDGETRSFDRGTVVVPMGIQEQSAESVVSSLEAMAQQDGVEVLGTATGLTPGGIDLGSPSIRMLEPIQPLLPVGEGISSTEAGEIWHLLDQRYDIDLTMVDWPRLDRLDLDRYSHLILVSGGYQGRVSLDRSAIRSWIRNGGVLIALRGAVSWAEEELLSDRLDKGQETDEEDEEPDAAHSKDLNYADYDDTRAKKRISGAIFEAHIDTTHPLAFGYQRSKIPVFRNSTILMPPDKNPFANVARYTESPRLSGYASEEKVEEIAGTAVLSAARLGEGLVVRLVDNPTFRGVWYGTDKLLANSLFFGRAVRRTEAP